MTPTPRKPRLAALVTHPVQYFAPVFRLLAARDDMEFKVFFICPHGLSGEVDPFFKKPVAWDSGPVQGFDHAFVSGEPLSELSGRSGITLGLRSAAMIRDYHPDFTLIFSYSPSAITAAALRLAATGHQLLLRAETTDVDHDRSPGKAKVRDLCLRGFYKLFTHVFPIGTNSREHYLRLGVALERMTTALYAVDADYFAAQAATWLPRRDELRRLSGMAPDDTVLVYCGKLHGPKDPLLLGEVLARLPSEAASRTWLIVIGDGDLRAAMESSAKAALGDRAVFAGFQNQSELGRYYAQGDALVLPSSTGETWGLVVNEALHFGLKLIVSSRVGAGRDLVREGHNGFVFPAGDSDALAERIVQLDALPVPATDGPELPHPRDLAEAVAAVVSASGKGAA